MRGASSHVSSGRTTQGGPIRVRLAVARRNGPDLMGVEASGLGDTPHDRPLAGLSNDGLVVVVEAVVLLVAIVPIANQVVCTSTLALGGRTLAEHKAIVTRLSSIEELAGMAMLCSDKTGTLTLNKMVMQQVVTADGVLWACGRNKSGTCALGTSELRVEAFQRVPLGRETAGWKPACSSVSTGNGGAGGHTAVLYRMVRSSEG